MGKGQSKEKCKKNDPPSSSKKQVDVDFENKYEYVTDRFLGEVADDIGAEWIMVCVALGVKRAHIDHINCDSSLDVKAKIHKGLIRWRDIHPNKPEEHLINELQEALSFNDRTDLAEHILTRYNDYVHGKDTNLHTYTEKPHQRTQTTTVVTSTERGLSLSSNSNAESSDTVGARYNDEIKSRKDGADRMFNDVKLESTIPEKNSLDSSDYLVPETVEVKPIQTEDPAIVLLRQTLYEINNAETERVPVSPLQKTSRLPLEEIYAPVSIREDLEYKGKGRNMGREVARKRTKAVKGPEDIFCIDGHMTRNAFMLGDAAHGKSVFCLRLVKDWCKAKKPVSDQMQLGEWEKVLNEFDFLFLVQLRHVFKSRASIIDMICLDVFQHHPSCRDTIRHVLSSKDFRCLVIIDGLDEWKYSEEARSMLRIEGLPNTDDMECCTLFWTSRPWKFDAVSEVIRRNDRVLEINGLDKAGIETLIEKILTNFYEIDKTSEEFKMKYKELDKKSKDVKLKSVMRIPLMAVACIQIWFEQKSVGESMVSLYVALIELLIRRFIKEKKMCSETLVQLSEDTDVPRPQILMENDSTKDFIPVLMKLGKVAYEDLISEQTHLVFRTKEIEKVIGKHELNFALRTGLLSQCEAPGTFHEENVSVNFFHKSVEEFLAAIYIESIDEVYKTFYAELTSVNRILELGNVLIFLSGLSPKIGSAASKGILDAVCSEEKMKRYREYSTLNRNNEVELLYKTLASCYREMKQGFARSVTAEVPLTFHIADVFVNNESDSETIQTTSEILSHHYEDIMSLYVWNVPSVPTNDISDTILMHFLDKTISLESLCISSKRIIIPRISDRFSSLTALVLYNVTFTPEALEQLEEVLKSNQMLQTFGLIGTKCRFKMDDGNSEQNASLQGLIKILPGLASLSTLYIRLLHEDDKQVLLDVLHKLQHLRSFCYDGVDPPDNKYDSMVVKTICSWSELQILNLGQMTLENASLRFQSLMDKLEEVMLWRVVMSAEAWNEFIESIIDIKNEFGLKVIGNDLEEKICPMLRSTPNFKVSYDGVDGNGDTRFYCSKLMSNT